MAETQNITCRMTDKKVGNGYGQAVRRQPYTFANRDMNTVFTPMLLGYNLIFQCIRKQNFILDHVDIRCNLFRLFFGTISVCNSIFKSRYYSNTTGPVKKFKNVACRFSMGLGKEIYLVSVDLSETTYIVTKVYCRCVNFFCYIFLFYN